MKTEPLEYTKLIAEEKLEILKFLSDATVAVMGDCYSAAQRNVRRSKRWSR